MDYLLLSGVEKRWEEVEERINCQWSEILPEEHERVPNLHSEGEMAITIPVDGGTEKDIGRKT